MLDDPTRIIATLGLLPHPEGGHYRETWRARESIPRDALPDHYADGPRAAGTAIHFLLQAGEFSALHHIAADELWFFHAGDPLEIVSLDPATGAATVTRLGLDDGATPSHVVPQRHVFGARVAPGGSFTLVSCTVSPGFDFRDFAMPGRAELLAAFPQHAELVTAFTRPD